MKYERSLFVMPTKKDTTRVLMIDTTITINLSMILPPHRNFTNSGAGIERSVTKIIGERTEIKKSANLILIIFFTKWNLTNIKDVIDATFTHITETGSNPIDKNTQEIGKFEMIIMDPTI